jgi:glycosyltransferase involved in cell wall biosynthesis
MEIIGLVRQNNGCDYHRILLPLGYMNDVNCYVSNMITEERENTPTDIIVYNRINYLGDSIKRLKDKTGAKVVMDIDDYWKLPTNHLSYEGYQKIGKQIETNIAEADLVTVTNHALLDKVIKLNSKAIVLPNCLPYGENQFIESRRESERVRVMWCGSLTHQHDLNILKEPFKRVRDIPNIELVIGGYDAANMRTKQLWDKMIQAFSATELMPSQPPTTYMRMYENADICVIPLENTEWHACKSNLKILEAASKRLPVIVSNVAPYNIDADAPVLWVNKQSDWFNYINLLVNNPNLREQLGNALYEWAKKKYNFTEINNDRRQAYSDLCKA